MEAFCTARSSAVPPPTLSLPHSPRLPPLHFYLTSSNYFRVIPASRRLKRHWETKPSAPPTDPCAAQSQPGKGLYVANCIAAAVASGSNRARRGCLLSEGRAAFITAQRSWNISQSLHEKNGGFVCSVVAIIKPYFRTALSLKVLILKSATINVCVSNLRQLKINYFNDVYQCRPPLPSLWLMSLLTLLNEQTIIYL